MYICMVHTNSIFSMMITYFFIHLSLLTHTIFGLKHLTDYCNLVWHFPRKKFSILIGTILYIYCSFTWKCCSGDSNWSTVCIRVFPVSLQRDMGEECVEIGIESYKLFVGALWYAVQVLCCAFKVTPRRFWIFATWTLFGCSRRLIQWRPVICYNSTHIVELTMFIEYCRQQIW